MTAGSDRTEPANISPPQDVTQVPVSPGAAGAAGDACPNCGSAMSSDQRYCLNCGHRRGDPRLPFMDAVVFMEAMSQPPGGAAAGAAPPPTAEKRPRFSPSTSLIAGVATLVLAIGVGVLIGRTGDHGSTAATPRQVINVGNGSGTNSGGEETATANEGATKSKSGGKSKSKGGKKEAGKASPKQAKKAEAKAETGSHGASKSVEEVIKPEGDVKLAEPETQVGGKCTEGTAGCENGKFEGNFFGE